MNTAPRFVTLVRIALSVVAIPVVVAIVRIALGGYLQRTDAGQLQDNPQGTGFHLWLADNQGLITLIALLLLWAIIWAGPILRYYYKH